MKLRVFLADLEMTAKDFSFLLDINHRYLSRIMNGHIKPGRKLAKEIERLTDGKVIIEANKPKKNK